MGNFYQPPPPYYSPQPYYSPAPTFSPPPTQPNYIYGQQPMDMSYTGIMADSYYSNPAAAQPYTPVNYGKLGSYPMAPSQFQPYNPPAPSGFRPGETVGPSAVLAPVDQSQSLQEMANAPVTPSAAPAPVQPYTPPAPIAPPPAPVAPPPAPVQAVPTPTFRPVRRIMDDIDSLRMDIADTGGTPSDEQRLAQLYAELEEAKK